MLMSKSNNVIRTSHATTDTNPHQLSLPPTKPMAYLKYFAKWQTNQHNSVGFPWSEANLFPCYDCNYSIPAFCVFRSGAVSVAEILIKTVAKFPKFRCIIVGD